MRMIFKPGKSPDYTGGRGAVTGRAFAGAAVGGLAPARYPQQSADAEQ